MSGLRLIGAVSDQGQTEKEIVLLSSAGGEVLFTELHPSVNDEERELFNLLEYAWISMNLKEELFNDFKDPGISREAYIRKLREKNMPLKLRDAVMEVLNLD